MTESNAKNKKNAKANSLCNDGVNEPIHFFVAGRCYSHIIHKLKHKDAE